MSEGKRKTQMGTIVYMRSAAATDAIVVRSGGTTGTARGQADARSSAGSCRRIDAMSVRADGVPSARSLGGDECGRGWSALALLQAAASESERTRRKKREMHPSGRWEQKNKTIAKPALQPFISVAPDPAPAPPPPCSSFLWFSTYVCTHWTIFLQFSSRASMLSDWSSTTMPSA